MSRRMNLAAVLVAASAALALAVAALAPAATIKSSKHGSQYMTSNMHNARYCEVLEAHGALPDMLVTIYNTLSLNDCPPRTWSSLDANRIKDELGASFVILNGPRYWMVDRACSPLRGEIHDFDGLRARDVGDIHITSPSQIAQIPYTRLTINRSNTFAWGKGRRIFELIDPDGNRYVLQAYSQIVDPHLTKRQLRGLGSRLDLPAGWRYRSRVIRHPIALTTNAKKRPAVIVRDELKNTYQYEYPGSARPRRLGRKCLSHPSPRRAHRKRAHRRHGKGKHSHRKRGPGKHRGSRAG